MNTIYPVILCGGSGTRLWPLSREQFPKQLIAVESGEHSLLQQTIKRLSPIPSLQVAKPILVTNEGHRFLVAEQLLQADISHNGILLEPAARNTAPALTIAACHALQIDQEAVLLVLPADHVIKDHDALHEGIKTALTLALADYIVTFGITPNHAETGFGYIRKGDPLGDANAVRLDKFVEKPDVDTAKRYLQSGDFLWNSGMFCMKASSWLKAIEDFSADIYRKASEAYAGARIDHDFIRVDSSAFEACPSDSIDYAVMEPLVAKDSGFNAAVVPLDAGWSDVGSWESFWDISSKNAEQNVTQGDVITEDTHNSILLAKDRLLAVLGLDNLIAVETADAVLVADKSRSQDVKKIVEKLKAGKKAEAVFHAKVYRPWGSYQGIDKGDRFQVKHILVKPGASLSLQMHHHRAEHWIVVCGTAKVTRGEDTFLLSENQSTYIPLGVTHRLENPGTVPLEIIEVQSGTYLGEDDIVRFDDVYGRDTDHA